jgi:hypothetical protein
MNIHIIDNLLAKVVPEAGAQAEPATNSDGGAAVRVVAEQSRQARNNNKYVFMTLHDPHFYNTTQTLSRPIDIRLAASSRLTLYGLDHRVPAHDTRGALELGLPRAGHAYHLQEDEVDGEPRVRLRGLHAGVVCTSRP